MIDLDWTVLASGVVFLFTLWALNKILFRPLLRALDQRRERTSDVQKKAAEKSEYHDTLVQQYADKIKQEKQRGYQLADTMRKNAMQERQKRISEARGEANRLRERARSQIEQEVEVVRQKLKREAEVIAGVITARVFEKP
jgi:F-type H+-transporting ATPase subunit b